jgi:SAM-dependent methyltransferase
MELLLGCGSSRIKRIVVPGLPQDWVELKTLDIEPSHNPDVVADLNNGIPYPDDTFDEVHAYEILEHLGQQGDVKSFFYTFYEIWRVLKPKGVLCATVPDWKSMWAWGDPGHTRIINSGSLVFLDQEEYRKQIGVTAMSDYRSLWQGDFMRIGQQTQGENFIFCLEAQKPARS